MNANQPPMPWYRLHLVTCLAMMIVGAALLRIQSLPGWTGFDYSIVSIYGWPLRCTEDQFWGTPRFISWPEATLNVVIAITLLVGVAFVFELLIRRAASRLQMSLTSLLVVIFALAVMLGERYATFNMYGLAEWMNLQPTLLTHYPWYCYVPVYFAIFCTLCSVAWLCVAAISHILRKFDR